ncbi:hypothetical protein [Cytobacillus oceanisediminis]|uniref:hypothetical protein n=1 Tax=Cytobacillus oceanisediminis TaxID=665099 RepID=UPI0020C8FE2A|nr:hypothetical protein [Cytobacillus oceanisediminis]
MIIKINLMQGIRCLNQQVYAMNFPVDLVKQQVTGTVLYKDKIYMTVVVDVKADTVQVQGDTADLGDLAISRESYIDMFKDQAKFFIDNHFYNPKAYYDELINNPSE